MKKDGRNSAEDLSVFVCKLTSVQSNVSNYVPKMQMAPSAHEEYDAMAAEVLLDPANTNCYESLNYKTIQLDGGKLFRREENNYNF